MFLSHIWKQKKKVLKQTHINVYLVRFKISKYIRTPVTKYSYYNHDIHVTLLILLYLTFHCDLCQDWDTDLKKKKKTKPRLTQINNSKGGVYMRKHALAWVSYRYGFFILCRFISRLFEVKVHFMLIKYMCDSKSQTLRMRYPFQSTGRPISH